MTFMESMDDQLMFVSSILRRSVAVILILLHLIWPCNNSASAELYNENSGGFPSVVMSNSSSTGVSLSNGKLHLDSTNANFVYALFPYIPFNSSEPSMGSFNTLFNFTNVSSVGALGIITINPNSDIMKLEDRLLAITNLPYKLDTQLVNNSNYLALMYNFSQVTRFTKIAPRNGGGPVMYFDYLNANEPGDQVKYFSGELQYFDPASVSKACASIPIEELSNTLCPRNYVKFGIYNMPSGYTIVSTMAPHPNLSVSVSSLVGFFAFGGGVFDVSFWEFTDLYVGRQRCGRHLRDNLQCSIL